MTLIAVVDIGPRMTGDLAVAAQCPDTTDTKDDLLRKTMLSATTIEPVGDVASLGVVVVAIGVEHQQRNTADRGHPDGGVNLPAEDLDTDFLRVPGGVQQAGHGHFVGGQHRVALLLPAGSVQPLPEIPKPVEKTDSDEGQTEVGGRLQVVAGQDPQAPRILGKDLADAELGGEITDSRRRSLVLGSVALEPQVIGEVGDQIVVEESHIASEDLVSRELLDPFGTNRGQQFDGVLAHFLPESWVNCPEKVSGFLMPRPAKVLRQRIKLCDTFGQHRMNGESSECTHEDKLHCLTPAHETLRKLGWSL